MAGVFNPTLAKRQLSEINRGLSAVNSAVQECDLAETCGNDCQDRRDALESIRRDLNRFKAAYFPEAK
jgi:hypothetical protein